MRVIVEGPDGAGKSTLIRGLKLTPVVHNGVLEDPFGTYLSEIRCDALKGIDRFYPSEQVYGPVMRNQNMVGSKHRMLDRVLLSQKTVLVLCLPPKEVARDNWRLRLSSDDEYVTKLSMWEDIYDRYSDPSVVKTHLPVVMFNFMKDSFDDCRDKIMEALPPLNHGPGIGWHEEGVTLLIGERPTEEAGHDYPFVHATGCSPWLAEQLDQAGVSERSLYWVNARDSRGRELDPGFLDVLKPGKIITLGEEAHRWAGNHNISGAVVSHPQWHKRFRNKEPYPLMTFLRRSE